MTTILRVKRRSDEVPSNSLMLSFLPKRQKLDSTDSTDSIVTQIEAQFAGTLIDQTEDITQHLTKVLPSVDEQIKGTKRLADTDNDVHSSKRLCKPDITEDTRYKVINLAPYSLSSIVEENSEKWGTLVEVEDSLCDMNYYNRDKDTDENYLEQYAYDLYVAQINIENSEDISIHELVFTESCSDESEHSENEDSESHPRNDYPDSDPDCSDMELYDDDLYEHVDLDSLNNKYYDINYKHYRNIRKNDSDASTSDSDSNSNSDSHSDNEFSEFL